MSIIKAALIAQELLLPPKPGLWVPAAPAIIRPETHWREHFLLGGVLVNPFWAGEGPRPTPYRNYDQVKTDSASSTTKTFSAFNFGTAHSTRMIVVGLSWSNAVDRGINSMTIGGVSATVVDARQVGTTDEAVIYRAAVPTGTSGDVVVNFSGIVLNGAACHVWYCYPTSMTPLDNGGGTSGSGGVITVNDLACEPDGFAIAVMGNNTATGQSWSWTGTDAITERTDAGVGGTSHRYSAADIATTESGTTFDLAVDPASGNSAMVCASWV